MSLAYRVDVMSRAWTIYYLTKSAFVKKYSDNVLAITECTDRQVYLRIDKLNVETIAHELFHCYVEEHSAPTMDLTTDQMEELCADITSKYGIKIHDQAQQVLHAYKVLRGRKVK